MGKLEEWGVYTDRFNPLRKLYIYPDERAAAEDMAFVFFTVREFPVAWRFFVTTAAFAGGVNWEHGYPLARRWCGLFPPPA